MHQFFPLPMDVAYMSKSIGCGKRGSHDITWRRVEK
jgi:hypothetical protein